MLLEKGEIEFYSLNSLLDALGLHLAVTVNRDTLTEILPEILSV